MNLPVSYIGFAQAIFAALIILFKKPLKIADVILGIWLIAIACMFQMNIMQEYQFIPENIWVLSLSLSMTFPPFLFLYSKYVTVDYERFDKKDYLHALPPFTTVFIFLFFRLITKTELKQNENIFEELIWLRDYMGFFYIFLLITYGVFLLRNVFSYRNQIQNYYSYKSEKISLNWLLFVVISFLIIFSTSLLINAISEIYNFNSNYEVVNNVMLLAYVYIVSIWGYRQAQLNSELKKITLNKDILVNENPSSVKYQKSGLKNEQAKKYLNKLVDFMNQTEIWKDAELSINKLAKHTKISRHHITQVLNEKLGKNFYVFINEYRIEYAKKLLLDSKYEAWSIVAIAYECGFNSKTAFNTFFKKYTGQTPSEFKKASI